jgi:hypothetical protein
MVPMPVLNVNTKGKLYEQYDEAGYQRMDSYDFKGNLLHKFRQVIADSELLSVFERAAPAGLGGNNATGWTGPAYRLFWLPRHTIRIWPTMRLTAS